jgi:hypothetical protein
MAVKEETGRHGWQANGGQMTWQEGEGLVEVKRVREKRVEFKIKNFALSFSHVNRISSFLFPPSISTTDLRIISIHKFREF